MSAGKMKKVAETGPPPVKIPTKPYEKEALLRAVRRVRRIAGGYDS